MMKNRYSNFLILCLAILAGTLFSCTNEEEEVNEHRSGVPGLTTDAEFIKLADNDTDIAGTLSILSDAPEVTLRWNTMPNCNLDTTQTTLTLKNGKGVLPIKWQRRLEEGTRGPKDIAYKAGVQITAGKFSKYIPLAWAEKVDSVKMMESSAQTRAGVGIMPRIAQISLFPTTVHLNDQTGGIMNVTLTDIPFILLDLSEFSADMNLDLSQIPDFITESQMLNFRWKAGGAPSFAFSARVVAMSEGLVQTGFVNYAPPVTLNFVTSNLPVGNISQAGGAFTFTFDGTYTGTLQARCLVDGVVSTTGTTVTNMKPSVTVPQNTTTDNRTITFQYKRENGNWTDLPVSTNRVQENIGSGIVLAGITWAPGNLVKVGTIYRFRERQEQYSGLWNGGDYFMWNTLDPYKTTPAVAGAWVVNNDPCRQVAPVGTWRTPSAIEIQTLNTVVQSWGNMAGVMGRYFGASNELFLPAAGYRYRTNTVSGAATSGLYWTSTSKGGGSAHLFGINTGGVNTDDKGHRGMGVSLRCVLAR